MSWKTRCSRTCVLGMENVEHADRIAGSELASDRSDYRGIMVTMIHKFRDMPAELNARDQTSTS